MRHKKIQQQLFINLRVFDTKNAGFLSKEELCRIMKPWLSRKELEEMVKEAQGDHDGLICYEGRYIVDSIVCET